MYVGLVDDASKWKRRGTVSCFQCDSGTDTNTKAVSLASEEETGFVGI